MKETSWPVQQKHAVKRMCIILTIQRDFFLSHVLLCGELSSKFEYEYYCVLGTVEKLIISLLTNLFKFLSVSSRHLMFTFQIYFLVILIALLPCKYETYFIVRGLTKFLECLLILYRESPTDREIKNQLKNVRLILLIIHTCIYIVIFIGAKNV